MIVACSIYMNLAENYFLAPLLFKILVSVPFLLIQIQATLGAALKTLVQSCTHYWSLVASRKCIICHLSEES